MDESENRIPRRTALKSAAASTLGVMVGKTLAGQSSSQVGIPPEGIKMSNDDWFAQRAWSVSANKVLPKADGTTPPVTSLAKRIHRPRSAKEI